MGKTERRRDNYINYLSKKEKCRLEKCLRKRAREKDNERKTILKTKGQEERKNAQLEKITRMNELKRVCTTSALEGKN